MPYANFSLENITSIEEICAPVVGLLLFSCFAFRIRSASGSSSWCLWRTLWYAFAFVFS